MVTSYKILITVTSRKYLSLCLWLASTQLLAQDYWTVYHHILEMRTYRTVRSSGHQTFSFGQWGHSTVWTTLIAPLTNNLTYLLSTYLLPLFCFLLFLLLLQYSTIHLLMAAVNCHSADTHANNELNDNSKANLPGNFLYTIVTFNQLHPTMSFCFTKTYLRIGNLCLQNSYTQHLIPI